MTTVSEAELAGLLKLKGVYETMMSKPDSREMLMRAVKIADPTASNEIDRADHYVKPFKDELKQTKEQLATLQNEWLAEKAERQKQEQQRQFENQWAEQENSLRRVGYMDKAIERIKALAVERGVVNLEDAAAIYDKTSPPPEVVRPSFGSLALMDGTAGDGQDEYMKKLFAGHGESAGETRKQVRAALAEVRGRAA